MNTLKRFCALALLLFALVGCGPSPDQLTATVQVAEAMTLTAAPTKTPTLTPTLTPTPTRTPTNTPEPTATPIRYEARGNLKLIFKGYKPGAVLPKLPLSVTIEIKPKLDGENINQDVAIPDGGFSLNLQEGEYEIINITISASNIEKISILTLVTRDPNGSPEGPIFTVNAEPCTFIGNITMTFYRLPPGNTLDQLNLGNQFAVENKINIGMTLDESGTFLPFLNEVKNAGICNP